MGEDGSHRMNPVTEVLIFRSMSTGMGEITEANWREVATRILILGKVLGAEMVGPGGVDVFLTAQDVKAHIGLKTNVGQEWSKTKFNAYVMKAMRENALRAM